MDRPVDEPAGKLFEGRLWKWFGEDVSQLFMSGDIPNDDLPFFEVVAHQVNFDPDVLGPGMIYWILQDLDARLIIPIEGNCSYRNMKILQEFSQPDGFFRGLAEGDVLSLSS